MTARQKSVFPRCQRKRDSLAEGRTDIRAKVAHLVTAERITKTCSIYALRWNGTNGEVCVRITFELSRARTYWARPRPQRPRSFGFLSRTGKRHECIFAVCAKSTPSGLRVRVIKIWILLSSCSWYDWISNVANWRVLWWDCLGRALNKVRYKTLVISPFTVSQAYLSTNNRLWGTLQFLLLTESLSATTSVGMLCAPLVWEWNFISTSQLMKVLMRTPCKLWTLSP